ncbi:MAG: hypothetical protein GX947_01075 [Tissierellia bacterium]|nr:hypothetical protein [Tissierellia bacterium]
MKKKLVVLMAVVMVLGTMSVAFADSSFNPASIFAKFKGIDEEAAYQMRRDTGMRFGELAEKEGFSEEFREEMQKVKKARLEDLVKEGRITQERANEILANFETCDGTRVHMQENRGLFGKGLSGKGLSGQGHHGENRRGNWK